MNTFAEACRRKTDDLLAPVILILSCLLLYVPSVSYFFAQDDFLFLYRALSFGLDDLSASLMPAGPFFRPLSASLYFGLMLKLFGLKASAYHLFSIGLLCSNVLLLYALGGAVFRNREAAFATAFIYLTRGAHFETVSWVSGIQDLLMIFFVLVSLNLYLKPVRGDRRRLFFSLGAFVLALLSKETAIVLPFLLLAGEAFLERRNTYSQIARSVAPFFIVVVIFVLIRFMLVEPMPETGEYSTGLGVFWITNLARYFLASFNLFLIPVASSSRYPALRLLLSLAVATFLLLAPYLADRRRRNSIATESSDALAQPGDNLKLSAFGLALFLFGVLPALQFRNRFEPYYADLACIGIAITLATVVFSFSSRRLRAAILVGVFAISIATNIRLRVRKMSHVGRFSVIAEMAIDDLRPTLAEAPPGATVYIADSDRYLSSALYSGLAIKTFFPAVESVIFDDMSSEYQLDGTEIVFRRIDGRLTRVD